MPHELTHTKQSRTKAGGFSRLPEPQSAEPSLDPMLELQQQAGNQAVQHLLRSGGIRPKLAVSNPNDPEEQEADRVADQVMRSPEGQVFGRFVPGIEASNHMREELREKPPFRRSATKTSAALNVPKLVADVLSSPSQSLAPPTQAFFEARFGHDFSRIRVHTDEKASHSARNINALSYSIGNHLVFGSGQFDPESRTGRLLLAHELTHSIQQEEVGQASIQRQAAPVEDPAAVPPQTTEEIDTSTPHQPPVAEGRSSAIRERYSSLFRPSLDQESQHRLQLEIGGAEVVEKIRRRDELREQLARISAGVDSGNIGEADAITDYETMQPLERDFTAQIDAELAALGVNDENELIQLVEVEFPQMFLLEAQKVAIEMLNNNEMEARSELERYSAAVCSPDIEGLLDADRILRELDPTGTELSIQAAERALALYKPIAGVLSSEEFAAQIPPSERAVMVDIANLNRNRVLLPQQQQVYQTTRAGLGRRFPILLSNGYRPGSFSFAPAEDLSRLVAEPVTNVLENITRVRSAIEHDKLKVWNMRFVLDIARVRLGVSNPVLLKAIQHRIESIQKDERFLGWVKAALAISTSVLAGILFTPAAGAAVAAVWGTASLLGSIRDYRNESAANEVALDPAVADLSINDPTLTWVILDAIFLAIDLAPVARALRPAARLLKENPTPLALRAFRRSAATELGEDAAARLSARAAERFGLNVAASEASGIAAEQLANARVALRGLQLSDEALVRILSKGADLNQVKGQLFEEVVHAKIAQRLAAGADELLGVTESTGIELIQGHRIADVAGRQLTDGIIARRLADGSLEILTVIEVKAGRRAAQGLRTASHGIGDSEEFARFVIEEDKALVVQTLRKAGLKVDAAAVEAGSETISEQAIEAIAAEKKLRRVVTQAELGGQVRQDIERLAPSTTEDMEAVSHLDEEAKSILVDGLPTPVRFSPTRTRFVGIVPEDVPVDAITRDLQAQRFNFNSLQTGGSARDLTATAQRLIDSQIQVTLP
ncbi:MAG: hypothetical protein C5B50_17500 [Verrucomicrobia bacterium]|nr:MAG: hypothetical protein C5B50_17500 [Verrucomicrobiota bacterium]